MSSPADPEMPAATQETGAPPKPPPPKGWRAWYFSKRGAIPIPIYAVPLFVFWKEYRNPAAAWPAGLALVFAGVFLRFLSVRHIGRSVRARHIVARFLVTGGPYSWTRNPIYIATLLLAAGFVVLSQLLWYAPILIVLLAVHYSIVIRHEERGLLELYGDTYRAYMARVPRWIPRPPRSPEPAEPHPWGYVWHREWKMVVGVLVGIGVVLTRNLLFRQWIPG